MLNQCNFIGRLGSDPEIRYTQAGKQVASFNIAVQERKDAQTEWVKLVLWEKLAEIAGEYLTKGSLIHVTCRLQTRKWQDQNGADRYTSEFVVREMKMLSPRNSESGGGNSYNEPPTGFMGDAGDNVPF